MGVVGGVRNVVSACVLSAELWWLESFPWVMVLGGVADFCCVRLPEVGCSVWVCDVRLWAGWPSSALSSAERFCAARLSAGGLGGGECGAGGFRRCAAAGFCVLHE